MTLNDSERQTIVELELRKADINMAQAQLAADNGYWDLVANRLYYALFHAACGLMVRNHLIVNSHKGCVMLFNRHFIREGIISVEDGRIFSMLQTKREEADYNCYLEATEEEIAPLLPRAQHLIDIIKQLL